VESFAEQLSDFLGIDPELSKKFLQDKHENRGVSQRHNSYRAWKRRLELAVRGFGPMPNGIKKTYIKIDRLISKKIKTGKKADYLISESWIRELSRYYQHSNRNLSDQFELDLAKYEYPL